MFDQFGAANHLALVVEEVGQQLVFLRGQFHRFAIQRNPARTRIQPHRSSGQFGRGITRGPADERAQPGNKFLGLERLGQIIIGARIKPCHLVGPAIARGQHQHRKGAAFLAPHAQHRQPINLRQAKVEHHRVIFLGRTQKMAVLAIGGQVNGIAGLFQRGLELTPQRRLVFDDQYPHGQIPR